MKVIAGGLRDNHHLYGLHIVGNAASIDADGLLPLLIACPVKKEQRKQRIVYIYISEHLNPRRLKGCRAKLSVCIYVYVYIMDNGTIGGLCVDYLLAGIVSTGGDGWSCDQYGNLSK